MHLLTRMRNQSPCFVTRWHNYNTNEVQECLDNRVASEDIKVDLKHNHFMLIG